MPKLNNFTFAYNSEPLRDDPSMTRDRLAKMVKGWRKHKDFTVTRTSTKNSSEFIVIVGGLTATARVSS